MSTTCAWNLPAALGLGNLVDIVLVRIDLTREACAGSFAFDAHTKVRAFCPEWCLGFDVDWVPAESDKRISIFILIGASDVWGPVAMGLILCTPDTTVLDRYAGRIDEVVGSGGSPIGRVGYGEDCVCFDVGRDQHIFVAREDSLTKGDGFAGCGARFNGTGALGAIRLVREGLLNFSIRVAVKTAILEFVSDGWKEGTLEEG